jgi:hypothetical protein
MTKPIKRIAIVDAGKDTAFIDAVLDFVREDYHFDFVHPREADYIFHSCMGKDVLKYDGIRIFATGECVTPDFNICDYALGFDHIQLGDRYCRLPLIKLFKDAYSTFMKPRPNPVEILKNKSGFCAYVMSNTKNSAPEREKIFNAMSEYKQVDSGGKWKNNIGGPVTDKIAFQANYKFVLAIENYSHPGYVTEKFAQAAQSNAIPIYWGDPTIVDTFNPRSFINCHQFDDQKALISHIRHVDEDDNVYKDMLLEPWFRGKDEPQALRDATYTQFLSNILDQSQPQSYRRNQGRWGKKILKGHKINSGLSLKNLLNKIYK